MNTVTAPPLNATHRCDACGAQAYVRVDLLATARQLLFCGNHWGKVKPAMQEKYGDDIEFDDSALTAMRKAEQEHPVEADA